MLIIDTDTNCIPHIPALKKRGVTHIGRYYARSASYKRLTKDEAQALSDAGFHVFVVYEDSGDPVLSVDRGRSDAQIAWSQARSIGQPPASAIYFAMEHLPHGYNPEHIPGLKLYFEGIRRTFGGAYKVGCYSNGSTLEALLDAKLIDFAWVSASTSFHGSRDFLKTDRWHLAQRKVDLKWYDDPENPRGQHVSADTNDVQGSGEFGAFALPPAEAAVADASPPPQGVGLGEGSIAGSVAAAASFTPKGEAPSPQEGGERPETDRDQEPETAGAGLLERLNAWWGKFNFRVLDELAEKGSRTATSLKSFKGAIWKGAATAVTTGTTAATLVDPNKGTAQVVGSWGSQHPFLLAALCAGAVALVLIAMAYYYAKKIEKGLAAAAKDGRYAPRGAQP